MPTQVSRHQPAKLGVCSAVGWLRIILAMRAEKVVSCLLLTVGLLGAGGISAETASRSSERVELISGWQFRQAVEGTQNDWLPAQVPGDVHLDLLRNKLIPEPFYRDNEAKLGWIENASWSYKTTIDATPRLLQHEHVDLVFEGLDTTAQVFLNGQEVFTADNMFRKWRIDVKARLHAGPNELRVEFPSPGPVSAALAAADPDHAITHSVDKAYLRKAAYEYGWDWGPRFVTSGVWRPVYLNLWDSARIDSIAVQQPDVTAAVAHVVVQADIIASSAVEGEVVLSYRANNVGASASEVRQKVSLHSGANEIAIPVSISDPKLWFPAGYGSQNMYSFDVAIHKEGETVDGTTVKTGLRSVVLNQKRDEWGRSFGFVINGIPIFAKGADVIPFDSFPSRVDEARYRRILQSARDANMNMIRLWGGGYYESDRFYELCDELGLMVWHDLMFASAWYPGTHDFKENVRAEVDEQVKRLRNHPSITLWSGNNEDESVLYAFLGGQTAEGRLQIWKDYLTVFSGIFPSIIQREDPEVPYWPSSPSADYEKTTDAFQAGDAHDWSIWHGREPFRNYDDHFYRFFSEYGFQSFPELKTVETFTTPEDRTSITTPVMLAHQKNNEGNDIIHQYLLRDYPEPKDFASFLYVSQVLQAEGVKEGAEHMRRNRPRIMGSLFWQLNDCWPVASWSSIDSFGRWKALQYYARRFYSPVLVSPTLKDGKVVVYAVSDKRDSVKATLRLRVMDMNGAVVMQKSQDVVLPPLSSTVYMTLPLTDIAQKHQALSELFIVADLIVDGAAASSNLTYLEPTKQVRLLSTRIDAQVAPQAGGYRVTLSSKVLARDVYLTLDGEGGEIDDNYIDLLPGENKTVTVRTNSSPDAFRRQLKVVSLVDAFPQQP